MRAVYAVSPASAAGGGRFAWRYRCSRTDEVSRRRELASQIAKVISVSAAVRRRFLRSNWSNKKKELEYRDAWDAHLYRIDRSPRGDK